MAVIEGPPEEPVEPVSRRWTAAISLANLGLFMAYFGPLAVLMPNQVQDISGQARKVAMFGLVTGLGALTAVVANPLAGALSDRTASRFGRRRPWALCGALASALALILLAGQHTVAGVALGWCLAQAGLNAMQAGIAASVPDRVPVSQRGAVSGWLGAPQCVGVVLAVFLVSKVAGGSVGYLVSFLHPELSQAVPRFDMRGSGSFSWLGEFFACLPNTGVPGVRVLRPDNDQAGHAARRAANGSCSM
jgi:MFS family permease